MCATKGCDMLVPANADYVHKDLPYIAEYNNWLDPVQCQHIIDLCRDIVFTQGQVRVGSESKIDLNARIAFTHKINEGDPPVLGQLVQRVTKWLALPNSQYIEHGLLVRYPPGGHFGLHTDQISNTCLQGNITHRVATLIVYLNDNFDGGYTVFPKLKALVKPVTGKALFFRYNYNSGLNELTEHAGGWTSDNKFILVFFVRDNEYPDELRESANY